MRDVAARQRPGQPPTAEAARQILAREFTAPRVGGIEGMDMGGGAVHVRGLLHPGRAGRKGGRRPGPSAAARHGRVGYLPPTASIGPPP